MCKLFENYAKPTEWPKELCELDPDNIDNNGLQNEDLIVWMRTAALPNFRKLYRILDLKDMGGKLSAGNTYKFEFDYSKYLSLLLNQSIFSAIIKEILS